MRLSLLEQREAVLEVMIASLNDHFGDKIMFSIEKPITKSFYLSFFGNKYLNFFATTLSPDQNFEVIRKEYTNSKQVWKRFLQKTYVQLATTPFIYSKLYHYQLFLIGENVDIYNPMLIMGGNTRLRIIRAEKQETEVILKKGYPDSFIKNEMEFRVKYPDFIYIPQLLSCQSHSFVEALHPGIPINRLSLQELTKYRSEAYQAFYERVVIENLTLQSNYFGCLVDRVKRKMKKANILFEDNIFSLLLILFQGVNVPISYSHGDFQDANLIFSEDGLKIIDWESVSQRSVFYDYLTLFAASRHGFDMSEVEKLTETLEETYGLTSIQINCLYLLEEIHYYLIYLPLHQKNNESIREKILFLFRQLKGITSNFEQ